MGFPGSSAGKESACHAGDPGSIPGWGRSPGEGIGYPLQSSLGYLMAQVVRFRLVSILARRNPMDRGAW